MKIEVLGPGCPKCMAAENNVRQALKELNLQAEVVHVRDAKEIAKRRVMFIPGVVIDGKIMAAGKVPGPEEVKRWLGEATGGGA